MFFNRIYQFTSSTKLQFFQFHLLHRIIFTNAKLFEWKLVQSPLCSFCGIEEETIKHFFIDCNVTKLFFHKVKIWLGKTWQDLFLGNHDMPLCLEFSLIFAKKYLYDCKYKKESPNILSYKNRLINTIELEHFLAVKHGTIENFRKKWSLLDLKFRLVHIC